MRDVWADARRQLDDMAAVTVADPDPNLAREGIKPGQWVGAPHDAMPPNCPVHVVGRDEAGNIWVRNARGDLRGITPRDWNAATISDLFSPCINYAFWAWPGYGKAEKHIHPETGEITEIAKVKRVERDKLFTCLGNEASKKPEIFDPYKHHRGRGGWKTGDGEFLWHSGRHLWKSDGRGGLLRMTPGEEGGFLYTRQPFTIEPWAGKVDYHESPAHTILKDLRTWNWERPYLDPLLVIGWMAVAFMGAAPAVRPIIFTTGGWGVGKSTMHELMRGVLDGIVNYLANTTAAHIYQTLRHDVLPIIVDELENKAGSGKAEAIIDIARIAYSGNKMGRGGQDGTAKEYTLQSPFFFSAINHPQMTDADKSRMALLSLGRLDSGVGRKIIIRQDTDGRMILRQVMDGWKRFDTELLQKWWDVAAKEKLQSRDISTIATLLAACELLIGPETMEECGLSVFDPEALAAQLAEATAADRAARLDNWHKCINHLLSSPIESWREGVKPTVGGVMQAHAQIPNADGLDLDLPRQKLALCNLTILNKGYVEERGQDGGPYLGIPADGPMLEKLFQGSDWEGVWGSALKQGVASRCIITERKYTLQRIEGVPKRVVLLDWQAFQAYAEGQ